MSAITAQDGHADLLKDWGTGQPVVFSHGWPLNADAWESQMVFLGGNEMDTYSDDLATLIEGLDLRDAVLVGHSYGGSVISNAALGNENVKALVFVAAFAPEEGESSGELSGRFPGSTLGDTLETVPLADGTMDQYIRQEEYHQQFVADVPAERRPAVHVGGK